LQPAASSPQFIFIRTDGGSQRSPKRLCYLYLLLLLLGRYFCHFLLDSSHSFKLTYSSGEELIAGLNKVFRQDLHIEQCRTVQVCIMSTLSLSK